MLISSKGYDGAIIHIGDNLNKIEMIAEDKIYCEAGATLVVLCKTALKNQLAGIEFAYGIPGTIGGSIFMNAGAYGGEIKDILYSCTFLDENGKIKTKSVSELELSYRHSIFSDTKMCILSAIFKFTQDSNADIKARMSKHMDSRKSKQPLEFPSAGSTFKRPVGNYASALIDQCGLKGLKVGGATVSEKHCGFVINVGNATSDDVIELVQKVIETVFEKTGYKLEREIKTIGI